LDLASKFTANPEKEPKPNQLVSELQCANMASAIFANLPQLIIHIIPDKNMPLQKLSLLGGEVNTLVDTRTQQQKAADTRKANKAAEYRKA
jgi:hypothetical protein